VLVGPVAVSRTSQPPSPRGTTQMRVLPVSTG
jgi:hypothetical protein